MTRRVSMLCAFTFPSDEELEEKILCPHRDFPWLLQDHRGTSVEGRRREGGREGSVCEYAPVKT